MAKLNGAAFDKAFAEHMVKDHKKDIAAYQKASRKQDAAGQYALSTLPTHRTLQLDLFGTKVNKGS
jgi:putative membrane protein